MGEASCRHISDSSRERNDMVEKLQDQRWGQQGPQQTMQWQLCPGPALTPQTGSLRTLLWARWTLCSNSLLGKL